MLGGSKSENGFFAGSKSDMHIFTMSSNSDLTIRHTTFDGGDNFIFVPDNAKNSVVTVYGSDMYYSYGPAIYAIYSLQKGRRIHIKILLNNKLRARNGNTNCQDKTYYYYPCCPYSASFICHLYATSIRLMYHILWVAHTTRLISLID